MSGVYTNGLPIPAVGTGLPLSGNETIPVDTNLSGGQSPQSVGMTSKQLSLIGFGGNNVLTDAATIALDASRGSSFQVTLAGNRTFAAFGNPSPGQHIRLAIVQDGTGSRTATWNANVRWPGGTAPTLTTTAGRMDVLQFIWDDQNAVWRGSTIALNYVV